MLTLAFDTSTNTGGVAVLRDETVLSMNLWNREGSHGELLTPALQKCLQEAGCVPQDLDAIAVGCGPGSFTGVRIAVNAARAFAYALGIKIFAFDSSEILADSVTRLDRPVAVLINAHKNLVFASTFVRNGNRWERRLPLEAYELSKLETLISDVHVCVGDAFNDFIDLMSPALKSCLMRDPSLPDEPRPDRVGCLAFRRKSEVQPLVWNELNPLYIRASGAEENLREGTGKRA